MAAPADYDAPSRNQSPDDAEDSAQILGALGIGTRSGSIDTDDSDGGDPVDLSDTLGMLVTDLSNWLSDEPTIPVVPQQSNEFICSRCFLIHPHSRLARTRNGQSLCRDCT
jgi:hypothetical protein